MRFKVGFLLAFSLLWTGFATAQSLGDVARKERDRREKNRERGVTAREFSAAEIFEDDDERGGDQAASEDGSGEDVSGNGESSESPLPERIDVPVQPDETEKLEEESRARKREEAEWRNRFHDARARLARAREQKRILDGVHHVPGTKLVDENGNVIVASLADLRRLVDRADRELREAEQALRELEEEARRAGIPPGWRR